jgi:hypothetical protein
MSPICWRYHVLTTSSTLYHYFSFDSGSVSIDDIEYRWNSKGTGSKVVVRRRYSPISKLDTIFCPPQLVNKDTNATVAESHSRRRSSIFRKPRSMGLEISEVVSHAVDVVVLTFILVWRERQNERSKSVDLLWSQTNPFQPVPSLDDRK